jgi:CubicO group peptidase (beta-lactamase class C family)
LAAVLSAALQRHDAKNSRSVLDFARETLFDPLGIQTRPAYVGFEGNEPWSATFNDQAFGWATDHHGRQYGCCMLKLAGADMVKIGELYLHGGRWSGQQIIAAEWIAAATTPIPLEPTYGRLWWIGDVGVHPAFYADGRGGQLIAVVPDLQLVVAISSLLDVKNETNKFVRGQDLLPMINDVVVSHLQ